MRENPNDNFVGAKGASVEITPSDNRGGGDANVESYADQNYDKMLIALEKNGDPDLRFFVEHLSEDIKEKLGSAFTEHGQDWNLLEKIDREYSSDVIERIQTWIKEVRMPAADTKAIWNTNDKLVRFLEQL